jgi:hypothetical protein
MLFLTFAQRDSSPRSGPHIVSGWWIECAQTHFAPVLLLRPHARVRSEYGMYVIAGERVRKLVARRRRPQLERSNI